MATITTKDLVQVSASYHGKIVATISSTGFASLAEVLKAVRSSIGTIVGIIELSVRNASQGWRENRTMLISPLKPGTQLSLF